MPIYEYKCQSCEHHFDALLRSSRETAPPCPVCGNVGVDKQFSSFSARVAGHAAGTPCQATGTCPAGGCPGATCGPGACPL